MAAELADAEGRWEAHVAPEVARLEAVIFTARQDVDHLVADQEREAARWGRLTERGRRAGRASDRFGVGLAAYRKALDEGQTDTAALGRRPVRPAPYVAPLHIQPPAERDFGPGI